VRSFAEIDLHWHLCGEITDMKKKLQSILVCPLCKGPLLYKPRQKELLCETDQLAYPVRNGIPVLLNADARKIES